MNIFYLKKNNKNRINKKKKKIKKIKTELMKKKINIIYPT